MDDYRSFTEFFTHKDFLPSADQLPGTLFSPMHFAFAAAMAVLVAVSCMYCRKLKENTIKKIFTVIWAILVVYEIAKITWETVTGVVVDFDAAGILPLYPCSIFMYAMPFAIWGKGIAQKAACGYVCTLGLLGGAINFVYPANVLNNYSCLSFAGMHTLCYHGSIVFCASLMLATGYHSYSCKKAKELLIPAIPLLIMSVPANIVNFSPINADYMFFKLDSLFFAPIGAALPKALCVVIVYGIYFLIHALPYLPSYFKNRKRMKLNV